MKRKIVTAFLVGAMVLSVSACGGAETETKSESKTETVEETATEETAEKEETSEEPAEEKESEKKDEIKVEKINLDNSEGTLVYTKHELTTDYEDKPAIRIYFDYTNKKEENSYAQMTFYPQVFQNGVECEIGISLEENEAEGNSIKEIQKGTTLNVAFLYTLQDSESPVTLHVEDQSSENLFDDIYQEQEIALK